VDGAGAPEDPDPREGQCSTRHLLRTADRSACPAAAIGLEYHLRIEDRYQPVEVAVTCSRDKSFDYASRSFHLGVRSLARLNAAARAASQLASRIWGALDDGCDLLEGHAEDIVQHERDPFGWRKRFEHHLECKADRVGQQCCVLGAGSVSAVDDRIGHVSLAPGFA